MSWQLQSLFRNPLTTSLSCFSSFATLLIHPSYAFLSPEVNLWTWMVSSSQGVRSVSRTETLEDWVWIEQEQYHGSLLLSCRRVSMRLEKVRRWLKKFPVKSGKIIFTALVTALLTHTRAVLVLPPPTAACPSPRTPLSLSRWPPNKQTHLAKKNYNA
jgi:hypothetical protein